MNASALFEKTLRDYSVLSPFDSRSLTKYCKERHVDIRALRYWMKKHSIPMPKHTLSQKPPSLVPLSILPCQEVEMRDALPAESVRNVHVSLGTGAIVSIGEITCQQLIELIHSIK